MMVGHTQVGLNPLPRCLIVRGAKRALTDLSRNHRGQGGYPQVLSVTAVALVKGLLRSVLNKQKGKDVCTLPLSM
jgi:hypothetical protein